MAIGRIQTLEEVGFLQKITEGWSIVPHWAGNTMDLVFHHDDPTKFVLDLLPEAKTQPYIIPRSVILHTNAGPAYTRWQSLVLYFKRADIGIEPHGQVDWDGKLAQTMPLNRKADCNYKANGWYFGSKYYGAISFETADLGWPTLDKTPWTLGQVDTLIKLNTLIVAYLTDDCGQCATWDDSGIDYHSKFKEWSVYVGKTCPGYARIMQMDYIRQRVADNIARFIQMKQEAGIA